MYEKYVKRCIDIIVSSIAIGMLSPLLIIVSMMIYIKLGSPIIYHQKRPGKNEEIFEIIKYRTMTEERDGNGKLLSDEQRLTKFGKWLRSTSIDELPELINIIKGDMSLIGPRPLLVEYLPLYNKIQKKRHQVRPGLSGLAQINGRNAIKWEEKFGYDIEYVENLSFKNDVNILYKTICKVWKREGIGSSTCVTMEKFKGSN